MTKLSIVSKLNNFLTTKDASLLRVSCSGEDTESEVRHQVLWNIDLGFLDQDFNYNQSNPSNYWFRFVTNKYTHIIHLDSNTGSNANHFFYPGIPVDMNILVDCLKASILGDDYDIELIYSDPNFANNSRAYISFIAKDPGEDTNLEIDAAVDPNFTTIQTQVHTFEVLSGRKELFNYNRKIFLKLYIEQFPNIYERIYHTYRNVGKKMVAGTYFYDFEELGFILKDYLTLQPIYEFNRVIRGNDIYKRCKVEVFEEVNGQRGYSISATYPNDIEGYAETPIINSGIGANPIGVFRPQERRIFLNNHKYFNIISPYQPAWFSVHFDGILFVQNVAIDFMDINNNVLLSYLDPVDRNGYSGVIHYPVWIEDVRDLLANQDLFSIKIGVNTEEELKEFTYIIDYTHRLNERWLYYLNSLGGIDSIRVYDQEGSTLSLQTISNESHHSIENDSEHPSTAQVSTIGSIKTSVVTGIIDKRFKDNFNDLVLSSYIFEADSTYDYGDILVNSYTHEDKNFQDNPKVYTPYIQESKKIQILSKDLKAWEDDRMLPTMKFDYNYVAPISGVIHNELTRPRWNQREYIEFNITNFEAVHYIAFDVYGVNIDWYLDGVLQGNSSYGTLSFTDYVPSTLNLTIDPIVNRPVRTIRLVGYLLTHITMTVTQGGVINPNVSMHICNYYLPNIFNFGVVSDAILIAQMVEFLQRNSATLRFLNIMYHRNTDMMSLLQVIGQSYKINSNGLGFTLNAFKDPTITASYNTISTDYAAFLGSQGHSINLL